MKEEQKLQMINEIKQIERELYLKRSQLASTETIDDIPVPAYGLDHRLWKALIKDIGKLSIGGNSIEDIRRVRQK